MSRKSNKMQIRVHPNRTDQVLHVSTTGHFGKLRLTINPIRETGVPLSPSTDIKAYWVDVLVRAQAAVQSM